MVDSYPDFFHTAERKFSTYPQGSNLLSRSDQRSEDDKQNCSSNGYPRFHATSPRTSKEIGFL
jgi:hypothetical protein